MEVLDTKLSKKTNFADYSAQSPLVLPDYTWEQFVSFEQLMSERGSRVRFLANQIEIMPPIGEPHEIHKCHLSAVLDVYLFDQDIEFFKTGSKTLRVEGEASCEPDESYSFHEKGEFPDLVIEIALTSGGLSKRALYARYPIPELWIWRNDSLEVHGYEADSGEYEKLKRSRLLPDLDLDLLVACSREASTSAAVRAFRERSS